METPNGFQSWVETHFEIVSAIAVERNRLNVKGLVKEIQMESGTFGFHDLALKLTTEFEKMNEGREWDGEFLDEVYAFTQNKLYPDNDRF